MNQHFRITASDGFPLSVTGYLPRKSNGQVVLINGATGVRQHFYSDFARHLSDLGFRVFTYDYRGIGKSRPSSLKNFQATMHEWGTLDYHSVLKYLFLTYTECQFTVIGHSVGGQLIGMSPLSENVDKIIAIGAQTPYQKNFSGILTRMKLFLFWELMIPVFTAVAGYFPASKLGLFEDLPSGVAMQWARWSHNRNYIFDDMAFMKERFKALHQPALMLSFSDDAYAPAPAVHDLMKFFHNVRWTHWAMKPADLQQKKVGHFGFFRKRVAGDFWGQLTSWISQPSLGTRAA